MFVLQTKSAVSSITMSRTIIDILVLTFLVSQVTYTFGRLTTFSGPVYSDERKVICLSEDDGSALTWNTDSIYDWHQKPIIDRNAKQFPNTCDLQYSQIDCKMDGSHDCLSFWNRQYWELTNSINTPMGLVFDQRWEAFEENNLIGGQTYQVISYDNSTTIVYPFSIRAVRDVHILICNTDENDLCYWVIIGGWKNTRFVIRKCPDGVPIIGGFPRANSDCIIERAHLNRTALHEYEWRSFILTWNSETRKVSLYDTDQLIMTYTDDDEDNDNKIHFAPKNVFIRSPVSMLIRCHRYNYLYTTTQDAILTSNTFILNTNVICLQILIGLCAECDADILLRNSITNEVLYTVTVKGSSVAAIHGLPMWQSVKIMSNLTTNSYVNLKIVVIPKLNLNNFNPIWAIANVRECFQKGCLRQSVVSISQDWIRGRGYFWPEVNCQKLFYKEQSVVYPLERPDLSVELDNKNCPRGYLGPACHLNCKNILESQYDCKAVVICHNNGCTCPLGYVGPKCGASCNKGLYGHACKGKCGSCLHSTCDRATGECTNGCRNTKNYTYVPHLCQIGIGKPQKIQIAFMNQTTIVVTVPMKWEEQYEKVELSYFFKIEMSGDKVNQEPKRIFENTTDLIGIFTNLNPGTAYNILCVFSVDELQTYSSWEVVNTDCDPIATFSVTPNETSIIVDVEEGENQPYSCPMNSYSLQLKHKDDLIDETIPGLIISFPYKFSNLTPYKSYNVTISSRDKNIFSREVRTLQGVPSEVLNFKATPLSSSRVCLFWTPPLQPNGVIKDYVIYLRIKEYFGCRDFEISATSNDTIVEETDKTEITVSGLHAYVKYDVQVVVRNSEYVSKAASTTFKMDASVIPAVTFSQLRRQGWTLLWGPPKDCTAILGPLKVARIEIRGISNAVQHFNVTKNTERKFLNIQDLLHGYERYVANIFALRGYNRQLNISVFEPYEFETPPKAPPNITNLEVVEVNNGKTIYLRWQSPIAPHNGILSRYGIIVCSYKIYNVNEGQVQCPEVKVELRESCDFWENYICKSFPYKTGYIHVVAYNMNVSEASRPVEVTAEMFFNTTPDPPSNFTFTIENNSVIDLKWLHPWRTGRPLKCFAITVEKISSNLRSRARRSTESMPHNFVVTDYMRIYSEQLYLLPSTQYNISIKSVTTEGKESETRILNIRTPSTVNFNGNVTFNAYEFDSTIAVDIPYIVNNTRKSMLYIIVNGPSPCENYIRPHEDLLKEAGVQDGWQAVALPSSIASRGKVFTLGGSETYGDATSNCPLKSGVSYDIAVIIKEPNFPYNSFTITRKTSSGIIIGMKPNHPESWLVPILIIFVVIAVAVYFYQRKRQKTNKQLKLQDEMVLSQNIETYDHDTKSMMSNSKQAPSTPSDRQSLSRATTPEVSTITLENNDEEKEVTSLVKVKDFEDYVRQAIESGLLDKQYETFPRGQTQPWEYGKLPQNKTKNRYGNLIAYDETRVILKKLPDDTYSDYINANYITGYKKKKRYIATQGPKPSTVVDFWRMIWQEKVLIICMLANVVENGKTKCEQYWPDIGKKKKYGEIIVLNATHNVFADYCFRTLHITYGKETRKVEHLHYTAWPDHGVPLYTHSVVTYLKKLLATPPGDGPVVVHCSAGVGRTGTIVLCDICLHRAAAEGVIDVFAETASIRRERANMVDNKQQYLLAHLALVECLLTIPTTLPCNETLPTRIKVLKKQLPAQQQRLQSTAWQDEALRPVTSPPSLSERNRAKNRFPELISGKVSRIYLKRYPASDEDSDYLSAVYVDGVKLQNQYLATQLPMPSTINDFWRMIAEFKVELIVMLQPPDPDDSTCCTIAPASGEFKPTPYLNITAKEIVESENYTSQKLLLVDNSEKPSREQSVTILCCTEWKPGRNQSPPSVMTMVTFWQATERIARGDGPTVTLCHDGVTGCGLYLALSFMLERMAVERECDVCLAVRAVRRSRPDFVRSLEQLEYLYDAAMTYLEYFETYANFS